MATIALAAENFTETVEGNDIVLIDFWAEWCGPCRTFGPVFEKVSEDFPGVIFAKVNTEEEQTLAGSFGISSIPTLMAIRENVVLYAQAGALPEQALRELVEKVTDVDMNEVRAEVARQADESGDPE
ncbi:MAG: thioredoxin [Actinomycetia bacterium]|nr:thioredoxin [Actinomycetes bacterium]